MHFDPDSTMPPSLEQEAKEQQHLELEVRVEQLGAALNADPEAFRALLQGISKSMQESAGRSNSITQAVDKVATYASTICKYAE